MCHQDGTGIGRCDTDAFIGSCMLQYFVNTICVDENYEAKNLTLFMNAL